MSAPRLSADLFEGLGLLDLLVLLDAHLDLARRNLRLTSRELKDRAEKLATELRVESRRTVESLRSTVKREVSSRADTERLEKRLREARELMRTELRVLNERWEGEKVIRFREKLSFFLGVTNIISCALLLGFAPTWIPFFYSIQICVTLPYRIWTYYAKAYHYFLFDLCYAVNVLALSYLWFFPSSTILFQASYGLSLGSLGTAIAMWRNSLVFHSLDKMISLAIHLLPVLVFTTIVHFFPPGVAAIRYPALQRLQPLDKWHCMSICMLFYLAWQSAYYFFVIVARKQQISAGRATSFTYLINDKKRMVGKLASRMRPEWREAGFMAGQAIYTFVTLLLPVFVLYDSKLFASLYLAALFGISTWNGASFYMDVFARSFEKELRSLRIQFEEAQAALSLQKDGSVSSELGGLSAEMSRNGSLEALSSLVETEDKEE